MSKGVELFVSSKTTEMKKVRVFVTGVLNKYGECLKSSLDNARVNNSAVRVTFTNYKTEGKFVIGSRTVDKYVSVNEIK